jgi:hypothetical protein
MEHPGCLLVVFLALERLASLQERVGRLAERRRVILYISTFCSYAIRHNTMQGVHPIMVVEVVPRTHEDEWPSKASFYPSEINKAIDYAEKLESDAQAFFGA